MNTPHFFSTILQRLADGEPVDSFVIKLKSWPSPDWMPLPGHVWTLVNKPGDVVAVRKMPVPSTPTTAGASLVAVLQARIEQVEDPRVKAEDVLGWLGTSRLRLTQKTTEYASGTATYYYTTVSGYSAELLTVELRPLDR
jgi:hypothetical protein